MSVMVEITNLENLRRVRRSFGVNSDDEAAEMALEKVADELESHSAEPPKADLPDEFWDELFSMPLIPSSAVDEALEWAREDRF